MKHKIMAIVSIIMACVMMCTPVMAAENTEKAVSYEEKVETMSTRATSPIIEFELHKETGYLGEEIIPDVGSNPTVYFKATGNPNRKVDVYVISRMGTRSYLGRCVCDGTTYSKTFNFLIGGNLFIEVSPAAGTSSGQVIYCTTWATY